MYIPVIVKKKNGKVCKRAIVLYERETYRDTQMASTLNQSQSTKSYLSSNQIASKRQSAVL
jgi:hypothetical protein